MESCGASSRHKQTFALSRIESEIYSYYVTTAQKQLHVHPTERDPDHREHKLLWKGGSHQQIKFFVYQVKLELK